MSHCEEHENGKDRVVFITKEEHTAPQKEPIQLAEYDDDYNRGLILPNGDINFNCPCLGGMASGPCGVEFRESFSCFHYSKSEVKGSECVDKFMELQACMSKYPTLYEKENKNMDLPPDEDVGTSQDTSVVTTAAPTTSKAN